MTATLTKFGIYPFEVTKTHMALATAGSSTKCAIRRGLQDSDKEGNNDLMHVVVNATYVAFTRRSTGLRYFYKTPVLWVTWLKGYDRKWDSVSPGTFELDMDAYVDVKPVTKNRMSPTLTNLYLANRENVGQEISPRYQRPVRGN